VCLSRLGYRTFILGLWHSYHPSFVKHLEGGQPLQVLLEGGQGAALEHRGGQQVPLPGGSRHEAEQPHVLVGALVHELVVMVHAACEILWFLQPLYIIYIADKFIWTVHLCMAYCTGIICCHIALHLISIFIPGVGDLRQELWTPISYSCLQQGICSGACQINW